MSRASGAKQAARARARERRLALDVDRQARDERIEGAAADVFTGLDERDRAEQLVAVATTAVGQALDRLLQEGLGVDAVARLVDLKPAQVRRFIRIASSPERREKIGEAPTAVPARLMSDEPPAHMAGEDPSAERRAG